MIALTAVLSAVILGLLVDRFLTARRHKDAVQMADILTTKVIRFAEGTNERMAIQAEETRTQVSEMATRIAHPEVMRPDIGETDYTSAPPLYQDDFDLVGKVVPAEEESVNGN